ncbi:MAG TPA: MarR family transcriptional regulator [Actinomycetota bacterium]
MPDQTSRTRDEEAVRRFVEHMAMQFAEWGFARMAARVLMTMMSMDEPSLSAADLAERLDVSPAAISGAVRYLMQLGLLAREPVPGTRRDRYRLPDDPFYEANIVRRGMMKTLADLTDEGVAATGGPGTPAGARIAEMRDFYRFVAADIDGLLTRWQAYKRQRDREDAR